MTARAHLGMVALMGVASGCDQTLDRQTAELLLNSAEPARTAFCPTTMRVGNWRLRRHEGEEDPDRWRRCVHELVREHFVRIYCPDAEEVHPCRRFELRPVGDRARNIGEALLVECGHMEKRVVSLSRLTSDRAIVSYREEFVRERGIFEDLVSCGLQESGTAAETGSRTVVRNGKSWRVESQM